MRWRVGNLAAPLSSLLYDISLSVAIDVSSTAYYSNYVQPQHVYLIELNLQVALIGVLALGRVHLVMQAPSASSCMHKASHLDWISISMLYTCYAFELQIVLRKYDQRKTMSYCKTEEAYEGLHGQDFDSKTILSLGPSPYKP